MTTLKLFVDCADLGAIKEASARPDVHGATTNPSLARKAGVVDYRAFCKEAAAASAGKPLSLEVIADDFEGMRRQAMLLAGLAPNIYVKIPVSDTEGTPTTELVRELSHQGVKVNVTAILTLQQVWSSAQALKGGAPSIISVFAGRIADAGVDAVPHMAAAVSLCREQGASIEVLWASCREAYNVVQAQAAGCDIITVGPELMKKLAGFGRNLRTVSLETVRMFRQDALSSGFTL